MSFRLLVLAVALARVTHAAHADALDAFDSGRAALRSAALPADASPAARVELARRLLDHGLLDEAARLLDPSTDAVTGVHDGLAARFELLVLAARFEEADALGPELRARSDSSEGAAAAWSRLLQLREDVASLAAWARSLPEGDARRLLAEADVAATLNDPEAAWRLHDAALAAGAPARPALLGASRSALRLDRVDDALQLVETAMARGGPDSRTLGTWASILVKDGRTARAIEAYERLAEAFPWDETSHYSLGNGYARLDYTQLAAASPEALPSDTAFRDALGEATALAERGEADAARAALLRLAARWPAACEPHVVLASLAWSRADLDAAEASSRHALALEPRYGRAHAILAKVVESRRARLDVSRARDERRFARARTPAIPGLERFVLNWDSLTPRHRKSVALSVEPLAVFVPVLVEAGQTFTVKPLHQLLSETHGHEPLRDERIGYDSRLWDDVRGCGGNDTVTGIEDVERRIRGGYDTVLHELAHQVHGILPEPERTAIEAAFQRAVAAEAGGTPTFLSRYQASSVWEYFAEGVQAAFTPRRDRWDDREIVLERLRERDPGLLQLVRAVTRIGDASHLLPTALVGRAWTEVEHDRLAEAWGFVRRAQELAPEDELVVQAAAWLHLLGNEPEEALAVARRGLEATPGSAALVLTASEAEVHATGRRSAARELLQAALPRVEPGRRKDVEIALGWLLLEEGRTPEALAGFDAVLAGHEDDPEALRGRLSALALLSPPDADAVRETVTRLVRRRSGSRTVRAEAAIALARVGDGQAAAEQARAGLANDPDSDEVLAASAYAALETGDPETAREQSSRALEASRKPDGSSWNDLAALVDALLAAREGRRDVARAALGRMAARAAEPPEQVYVPGEHAHRSVHRFGPLERELLRRLAVGLESAATAPR